MAGGVLMFDYDTSEIVLNALRRAEKKAMAWTDRSLARMFPINCPPRSGRPGTASKRDCVDRHESYQGP
jgi:hypothetical protein